MNRPFKIGDEVEVKPKFCKKKQHGVVTGVGCGFYIRVHYVKTYDYHCYTDPTDVRLLTCEETGGPNHDDPIEYANHFIQLGNEKHGHGIKLHRTEVDEFEDILDVHASESKWKNMAKVLADALTEANALNINWSSETEPENLEYYSEYKAVIKQGKKALARYNKLK